MERHMIIGKHCSIYECLKPTECPEDLSLTGCDAVTLREQFLTIQRMTITSKCWGLLAR